MITVSLTAFRSLLGLRARKFREEKERSWYLYRRMILFKKGRETSESELSEDQLPTIPSATLTGMRTFIRGNRDSRNGVDDVMSSRDSMMEAEHYIKVTQKISSESVAVRFSKLYLIMIKTITYADIARYRQKIRLQLSTLSKSLEGPGARKVQVKNIRGSKRQVYAYEWDDGDGISLSFRSPLYISLWVGGYITCKNLKTGV